MGNKANENRAFNGMHKTAKQRLKGRTPQDIADKTGFLYNEEKSSFEINALGQKVIVSYPEFDVRGETDDWYKLIIRAQEKT